MWPTSAAFKEQIAAPVHRMRVLLQVLDINENVLAGGEFHDVGCACTGEMSTHDALIDGTVDVDISRGARRTANVTLLNRDGEFSPGTDVAGLFYVGRSIRLWRGVVHAPGQWELVPIGTMFIDSADVVTERNMSLVVLSATDGWKKLNKAKFGRPTKYPAGTHINDVLLDMAHTAGVNRFNLDPLLNRTNQTKLLQKDLNYERTAIIGDEVLKLATDFGLDIYMNPLGRFTTEDLRNPASSPVVWRYQPGEDSSLLSVKATYTDDKLYNHILVTGTADENNPVYAEAEDNDPSSPTYRDAIGRRTFEYESKFIATVEQAKLTANKFLLEHLTVSEDIELQTVCNPAFEGNDVIEVVEGDFTKVNAKYRIKSFSVPLSSSRQSIRLARAINLANV